MATDLKKVLNSSYAWEGHHYLRFKFMIPLIQLTNSLNPKNEKRNSEKLTKLKKSEEIKSDAISFHGHMDPNTPIKFKTEIYMASPTIIPVCPLSLPSLPSCGFLCRRFHALELYTLSGSFLHWSLFRDWLRRGSLLPRRSPGGRT